MGAQRVDAAEVACKLGLGQGGVDFPVADVMQQHGGAALAALELGDQVMTALRDVRRDRTVA